MVVLIFKGFLNVLQSNQHQTFLLTATQSILFFISSSCNSGFVAHFNSILFLKHFQINTVGRRKCWTLKDYFF